MFISTLFEQSREFLDEGGVIHSDSVCHAKKRGRRSYKYFWLLQ